jgi:hypothetical protein
MPTSRLAQIRKRPTSSHQSQKATTDNAGARQRRRRLQAEQCSAVAQRKSARLSVALACGAAAYARVHAPRPASACCLA